jgi:hypothetical protein
MAGPRRIGSLVRARSLSVLAVLLVIAGGLGLGSVRAGGAPTVLGFLVTQSADGTAPFDATPGPGHDTSAANAIVRTHDTVTYTAQYGVNSGPATNLTIIADVTAPARWNAFPSGLCPGAGSSVSAGHLVCNVGNVAAGSSGSIPFTITVGGAAVDGAVLTMTSSISAQEAPTPVSGAPLSDTVSALPSDNVRVGTALSSHYQLDSTGTIPGHVFFFSLATLINMGTGNARGAESLQSPITYTLTPTYTSAGAPPVSALLYTWGQNGAAGACAQNGSRVQGVDGTGMPNGSIAIAPAATSRDVTDSGAMTCTQPGGPGTPVAVSIRGADTTGDHLPTVQANGPAIAATDFYLTAHYIGIWVPLSDASATPGQRVNVRLTASGFAPLGVSGQTDRAGADLAGDNAATFTLSLAPQGSFNATWSANPGGGFLTGQSVFHDGRGVVTAGQTALGVVLASNSGDVSFSDYILCALIDPTKDVVAGNAFVNYNGGTGASTVEYTDQPSLPDQRDATCGVATDTTTDGPWYATTAAVPGGITSITRVRARWTTLNPGAGPRLNVPLRALNVSNGTFAGLFGAGFTPTLPSGSADKWWRSTAAYSPDPPLGGPAGNFAFGTLADHVEIVSALARMTGYRPQPQATSAVDGTKVTMRVVTPTLTATSPIGAQPVRLTAALPASLTYVVGSSASPWGEPTVTPSGGGQLLQWTLPAVTPNVAVPELTFQVLTQYDAPTGTAAATSMVISSPADLSPVGQRTITTTVTLVSTGAIALVATTPTPLVDAGADIQYLLTYRDTAGIDFASTDIIDILPYTGDSRSPSTSVTSPMRLAAPPTVAADTVGVLYTAVPPSSLSSDPSAPRNQPASMAAATPWCSQAELGLPGCPATLADATAVRFLGGPLLHGAAPSVITLDVADAGTRVGDLASNSFTLLAAGGLPVSTDSATARVLGSTVSGSVYDDTNGNQVHDATEPGIGGATVTLSGTDSLGASVSVVTTTDPAGDFSFTELVSGTYTLTSLQPGGYTEAADTAGSGGGSTAQPDVISGLTVGVGGTVTGYLFADQVTPAVTMTASPEPGTLGAPVTLQAVLAGPAGSVTGTVTFDDSGTVLCGGPQTISGGAASCSLASPAQGAHTLHAVYSGDAVYQPGAAPPAVEHVRGPTTTTLTLSAPDPVVGKDVTLDGHVTGLAGTPTGTVALWDGTWLVASGSLDATGQVTFVRNDLAVGTHQLRLQYGGDALDLGSSSSPAPVTIGPAPTTTTVSAVWTGGSDGGWGDLTVSVAGPLPAPPQGTVTLFDNGTPFATVTLGPDGTATWSGALPPGDHLITGVYNGDTDDQPSASRPMSHAVAGPAAPQRPAPAQPDRVADGSPAPSTAPSPAPAVPSQPALVPPAPPSPPPAILATTVAAPPESGGGFLAWLTHGGVAAVVVEILLPVLALFLLAVLILLLGRRRKRREEEEKPQLAF